MLSNTLVFLPISWLVLTQSFKNYIAVWLSVLICSIPIALFSAHPVHGLSGVIYGLLGYLILIGYIPKGPLSLILSIICVYFFWESLIFLIPSFSPAGVSWIGHLAGFLGGILIAILKF